MFEKKKMGFIRALGCSTLLAVLWAAVQIVTSTPAHACNYGNNGEVGGGCGSVGPKPPPNPPCSGQCCGGDCCDQEKQCCDQGNGNNGGPGGSSGGGGLGGKGGTRGKPISLFSGLETMQITDLSVSGTYPITIMRQYDSGSVYDSPLGFGWAINLDKRLYKYADNSVVIRSDCGIRTKYQLVGGAYQAQIKGRTATLAEQQDGSFTLTFRDGSKDIYDAQGKLSAKQDARGNRLEMSYDARGRLPLTGSSPFSLTPAAPSVVAYDYRLTKIEERLASGALTGNTVTLTYNDTTGRLQKIRANDGREVTYQQDQTTSAKNGNLLNVTGLAGINSMYEYNDPVDSHNVTKIQHGSATDTPYINEYYTDTDKVKKQSFGLDTYEFVYSPLQTAATHKIYNPTGTLLAQETTTYVFDGNGFPKSIEWVLSTGEKYKKDLTRNTVSALVETEKLSEWPVGATAYTVTRTITYQYDTANNKTSEAVTLASGETITKSWTYQNGWMSAEQTVSSAAPTKLFRTEYTFYTDTNGKPTNIKEKKRRLDDGSFAITSYTYNSDGRLLTTTQPDGTVLNNEYTGDKLTRTYLSSSGTALPQLQKTFGYDANGNLSAVTDAKGNTTTLTFDDQRRITQITNALGESTINRYTGKLLTETEFGRTIAEGEGQITQRTYTPQGWVQSIKRKKDDGSFITVASYTYTSNGSPLTSLSYRDGVAQTTSFQYDALDRLIKVTDPANNVTQYKYDAMGNRIGMIDAKNRETAYTYDALDRLAKVEQKGVSPSAVTQLTYDAVGNILSVTDSENKIARYFYDSLSRRAQVIQPLGQAVSYAYDAMNRPISTINARGQRIANSYTLWGTLDHTDYYATATSTTLIKRVHYAYDNNGNITAVSDNTIAAAPLYTYTYDALNRVDQTAIGYLPMTVTLNNDYDRYGNRSQLVLQDGTVATSSFTYNKLNQLVMANFPSSQTFNLSYFPDAALIKQIDYPSGISTAYQYAANGQVQSITTAGRAGTLDQLTYSYDPVLNITAMNSTRDGGEHNYGYDDLDHLSTATRPANYGVADEGYEYDKVGNREQPGNAGAYVYDDNHRIIQGRGITYSYDADGNQTDRSDGVKLTFDTDSRMVAYTKSGLSAKYVYDPFGHRIQSIVNGNSKYFVWHESKVLYIYGDDSTILSKYFYFPGEVSPVLSSTAQGQLSFVNDQQGVPKLAIDNTQGISFDVQHGAFGNFLFSKTEESAGDARSLASPRFPGQSYDDESGYYYNLNRYYDPSIGRYISQDPMGIPASGPNLYMYANSNPIMFVDPLGLLSMGSGLSAYNHYCGGSRIPWRVSFSNINWGGAESAIQAQIAQSAEGMGCQDISMPLSFLFGAKAAGEDAYVIGRHQLRVTGNLELTCGCSWSFSGSMSSALGYDPYDFDPSNRGRVGEALTWIGRNSCKSTAQPFKIFIDGAQSLSFSGQTGGKPSCDCKK